MPYPDFEQSCAFLIHDTARLIRRRFGLSIRDLGLTQAKWRVLTTVLESSGISQSELAERLDIEKAPLGLALDWLEQAGWIERKADPADRRVRRVSLLPKAEPTIALMSERFRAIEVNYLRGFDTEEVAQMLSSLQVIRDALRAGTVVPASAASETYLSVLFECARLLTRRFDARLAKMGFTRNQWLIMNTVYRNEGLRQTGIAEATGIGAAPLGKVIDALQAGGWMERRADPRDRRANRLFLTRRAHHLLSGMRQRFEQLHAGLLAPLGPRRKQLLVNSLGWIRQRLLEESPQTTEARLAGAL
ncbi:MAG: MarR family transcriptional regulator [Pseudomonadales bacterium]|jgi:DNA-binding MarR family transcriptional regulator|nr:MarR family transcriptional regulator [Pseudomonadales bacterium]MBP9033688.1 MarR family transcriptional regulator [Pseudomonadales bacterium]